MLAQSVFSLIVNTEDFYLLQGIALRSFRLTDSCLSTSDSGEMQELGVRAPGTLRQLMAVH